MAVIAVLVLADIGFVAVRLTSNHPTAPRAAQSGSDGKVHPCNHGFYVSEAAHNHKGGSHVSSVAKSKLGKKGDCSAPAPSTGSAPDDSESDD